MRTSSSPPRTAAPTYFARLEPVMIAVDDIWIVNGPYVRLVDAASVDSFAQDIKLNGQLSPIGVRQSVEGSFSVVYGATRLSAFAKLGRKEIAAVILPEGVTEQQAEMAMLRENLFRKNLTTEQEATFLVRYTELLRLTGAVVDDDKAKGKRSTPKGRRGQTAASGEIDSPAPMTATEAVAEAVRMSVNRAFWAPRLSIIPTKQKGIFAATVRARSAYEIDSMSGPDRALRCDDALDVVENAYPSIAEAGAAAEPICWSDVTGTNACPGISDDDILAGLDPLLEGY